MELVRGRPYEVLIGIRKTLPPNRENALHLKLDLRVNLF